ncbi:MAG: hypothetical protein MUF09_12225 [Candidatus Nanopelagicales bacterium]|nr:hypothetical protein [Candidatus Nanopelagicales bacterium]
MNRALVAAGLLTVAAATAVGMVAQESFGSPPAPSSDAVCAAAADVLTALGGSVGDQVVLRTRAAHLADLLLDESQQASDAGSLASARRIVMVLDDPDATVADLSRVVLPVTEQCPAPPAQR